MPTEVVVALITVAGVVLTQFVTYLISRQNVNDLRVNIRREIEIIRKLQPDSGAVSKLEAHVEASVANLIYRDQRREELFDIIRTFAPLILVLLVAFGLDWWRRHGVPQVLKLGVAILYYQVLAVAVWLVLRYLWGLLKLAYLYSRLGFKYVRIGALEVRTWRLNRRANKAEHQFGAVLGIAEDLLAAAEQSGGNDERSQTARKAAVEDAVHRLAEIGLTMKSHPVPHY